MAIHSSQAVYTAVKSYCTVQLNSLSSRITAKELTSSIIAEICVLVRALKICNEKRNTFNIERHIVEGTLLQELGKKEINTIVVDDLLLLLGHCA
jgi:hypothetical protein